MTNEEIYGWLRLAETNLRENHYLSSAQAMRDIAIELRSREQPPADAVRVRIAVAVSGEGHVFVEGIDPSNTEREAMGNVAGDCEGNMIATATIVADIPKIPVVQGRIVETKS